MGFSFYSLLGPLTAPGVGTPSSHGPQASVMACGVVTGAPLPEALRPSWVGGSGVHAQPRGLRCGVLGLGLSPEGPWGDGCGVAGWPCSRPSGLGHLCSAVPQVPPSNAPQGRGWSNALWESGLGIKFFFPQKEQWDGMVTSAWCRLLPGLDVPGAMSKAGHGKAEVCGKRLFPNTTVISKEASAGGQENILALTGMGNTCAESHAGLQCRVKHKLFNSILKFPT